MIYQDREYQEKAVETLRENFRRRVRSQLLCCPTGGGKTRIAAMVMRLTVQNGKKILFLAHRRELLNQCADKLEDIGIINYSVIMAGDKRYNPNASVHIASIQTLMRREFPEADLIVIDEAHRAASKSYVDLLANYPNAKVLGLSATPERLDGKGLDHLFDELVEVITVPELIEQGYLVRPLLYTGKLDASLLAGVKKRGGDYIEGDLAEAMDKPKLIGDIIANWKAKADGKITVAFACSIEHAQHIAQEFFNAGVPAAAIDGTMTIAERESIISDWRKGFLKVVVNCMILTEGFDFPELECCILARPTKSIALALQMVGRIMRTAPGKDGALVLDHAGVVEEHGGPHIHRYWSLMGEQERKKKTQDEEIKSCGVCDMIFNPEPKAYLADVQEKLLSELRDKAKALLKKKSDMVITGCPGCGNSVCRVCGGDFKLSMTPVDIDGVAYTKQGSCPHCHAAYNDGAAHVTSGEEKALPESTSDMLELYDGDEIPLAVQVKNRYRQHMETAKKKGYKRGYAFHQIVNEFGEQAKEFIPRHKGDWWRQVA